MGSVDDIKDSFPTSKAATESANCTTGERNSKDESCKNSLSDGEKDIKNTEAEIRLDFKNMKEERETKIDEKTFGGCGPMFIDAEEDIMRNIDAMVLSHPPPKKSPESSLKNDSTKIVIIVQILKSHLSRKSRRQITRPSLNHRIKN